MDHNSFLIHTLRLQASLDQQRIDELDNRCAMLARRCAEQARHIADLLFMNEEDAAPEPDPIHAAIAAHQKHGVR